MSIAVSMEALGNGRYRARCASLPGCTADAQSREEAWEKITSAAKAYVASLEAVRELDFHEEGQAGPGA